MEAVRDGARMDAAAAPRTARVRAKVDARALFQKLVETRLATGEPYIIFSDTVNRTMPKHHRELGLKVSTSNLCSRDHAADRQRPSRQRPHRGLLPVLAQPRDLGRVERRQALHRGRDALPRQCAAGLHRPRRADEMARAKYSATRERSVGLGVMGFHSLPAGAGHRRSKARWRSRGTCRSSSTSAPRPTRPR